MGKIKFNDYTVERNPNSVTLLKKDKLVGHVLTYTSVAFFTWGPTIVGKEIELSWEYMTTAEFTFLNDLYISNEYDATGVEFDPQDGGAKTYMVQIKSLGGKYYQNRIEAVVHRQDIKMTLLILSEVT